MRRHAPWSIALLIFALQAGFAGATTIIPPADPGELAANSEAVFLFKAGPSRSEKKGHFIFTVTSAGILDCLKGCSLLSDEVELEVPGGIFGGRGFAVAGSPKFRSDEVYLVFANLGANGHWQPRLMADSVLRRAMDLENVRVLLPVEESAGIGRISKNGSHVEPVLGPVFEDAFLAQLREVTSAGESWSYDGIRVPQSEFLAATKDATECVFMPYTATGGPNSGQTHSPRWFTNPKTMNWSSTLDADLPGGGDAEVIAAVSNWETVGSTSLNTSSGGPVGVGTSWCDNFPQNAVAFNDACDAIPDLSGCSGTLGWGGPYFITSSKQTFDSQEWWPASAWGVMVNNGVGACPSIDYELFLTHELGHGLGFGHPSSSGDLMSSNCCANFSALDIQCVEYLYPVATPVPTPPTNTPTPTLGGPTFTPTPTPTSTPTLTWTPGGPTATPTATAGSPTSTPTPTSTSTPTSTPTPTTAPPAPSKVTVPVVVHLEGVGDTSWRSDVVVSNQNSGSQTLRFTYQTTAEMSFQVTKTLTGFATLLLEDLVENLFHAGEGRGPLDVEILHGGTILPVAVSRAYAENDFGNLGSGLPADVAPSVNVMSMPGLFHDDDFRTNIAVTAGDQTTWASFELFRGSDGLVAGGVQRKIEAGEQDQWSIQRLFGNLAQPGVPMTVRVTLTRPGIVYASLVDNASTDSAVFLGKMPANTWIVPAVAHVPGAGGTFWSSSVSIWNTTGQTAWVDLEYLPEKTNNSAGGLFASSIRFDPYASRNIVDVLLDKFGIEDGKGVLVVTANRPVTVTSRVFTDGPQGGSSGNGVRTVRSTALTSGNTVLPGVRLLEGFRTNIGVVTGERTVSFTFDLRDQGGTLRGTAFKTLPPRTLQQWSVEKLFGNGFVIPDPVGSIVVKATRPHLSYLTVIDGTSQDPVFVMPQ